MKILFVGAMDCEIDYIKSQMSNVETKVCDPFVFYLGNLNNKNIILVKSGIGKVMSGLLIGIAKANFAFDVVINIGIAGGVSPLRSGDIVIGKNYAYGDVDLTPGGFGYEFGQMAQCPRYFKSDLDIKSLIDNSECIIGDMCTCDSFTTSIDFVNKVNEEYYPDLNFVCFDMESAAFAQSCYFLQIPFIAIRSISDIIGNDNQQEEYKSNEINSSIEVNKFILKLLNNIK